MMDLSVIFSLVSSGAGLAFGRGGKNKARDAWQAAAEEYGLMYKPTTFRAGPKITGQLFGNDLTIDIKDRNTATAATRFRLGVRPLIPGLKLKKKGFWNSLGPRTATGDTHFDNQIVARSRDPHVLRAFLSPDRRTAIRGFLTAFDAAAVTEDEISFRVRGHVKNADEMIDAIAALNDLARVLADEAKPVPRGEDSGRPAAETASTDTEEEPAPETPREPEYPAELADEPAASSDSLASAEKPLTVEEFCATVFPPGVLSFSANQNFKANCAGQRIAWTGTLESLTPFTFDFDFGSGGGLKAVVTILETDGAGTRNVQAIMGLPPGIEGLKTRIGRPVAFTGRLLKVDGLAKRVVIKDAELQL